MSTPTPVFTAQFTELADALKTVAPVIPKRPGARAIAGVLLESDGTDLVVTGNNFHESIVVRVPDAVASPGCALVPHVEVTKVLKALVKGARKQDAARTPVTLRAHGHDDPVTVEVGENSIPVESLPLAEYPERPDVPATWVRLPGGEFIRGARRVLRACGRDDTLPMTCGVKIDPAPDGGIDMLATDRYCLAIGHVGAFSTPGDPPVEGTLVSGLVLEKVLPVLTGETVTAGVGPDIFGDVVALSTDRVTVLLRVHDAKFPDCRSVMPEQTATTLQVDRAQLRMQIERSTGVLAAKQEAARCLTLTLGPDALTVAPRLTQGTEHLRTPPLAAHVSGETSMRVRIPSAYLADAVDSFDTDTLTLHIQTAWGRPIVATAHPDGLTDPFAFKHLLMPVRPD